MIRVWLVLIAALFLVVVGCDDEPVQTQAEVAGQHDQTVGQLTAADEKFLVQQRAVVERHLTDDASRERYSTTLGKIELVQTILARMTNRPDSTYELQCLGIVLGDAFVQELQLEWVVVEDQYGRVLALRMPETSIILFPQTMISKRVERGEQVDVLRLFQSISTQIKLAKLQGA